MRPPSLNSLRTFLKVAELRSFSAAAEACNISQPALSRTIKLLEEDLGVRLFDRDSRKVALTPAGEALLSVADRIAVEYDQAFLELGDTYSGERGRVVIGALPSVAAAALPRAVAQFQERHSRVEIIIRDTLVGMLNAQLVDRQIDFAITTPPEEGGDILFEPLFEDECVLVGQENRTTSAPGPADWRIFRDHPFIAMAPRSSVRLLTDAAMVSARISVKPLFECGHLTTMGGLLAMGLGMTALPRSTLPLLGLGGELRWRRLERPQVIRTIGIAQLARRTLSSSADLFVQFVRRHQAEFFPKDQES